MTAQTVNMYLSHVRSASPCTPLSHHSMAFDAGVLALMSDMTAATRVCDACSRVGTHQCCWHAASTNTTVSVVLTSFVSVSSLLAITSVREGRLAPRHGPLSSSVQDSWHHAALDLLGVFHQTTPTGRWWCSMARLRSRGFPGDHGRGGGGPHRLFCTLVDGSTDTDSSRGEAGAL